VYALMTLSANQSVTLNVLSYDLSQEGTLDTASIKIAVAPRHGTALPGKGRVAYTPASGYAGVDAFQYDVQNNLGTFSNVATVSLSVQPPAVASNDTASVQADHSATINVLANDKSDGGTLNAASISIAAPPIHGTATVKSGEVVYVPPAGYSGSDTFEYCVKDNLGVASNLATVSVNVAAAPGSGGGGGGGGGVTRMWDVFALALLVLIRSKSKRWQQQSAKTGSEFFSLLAAQLLACRIPSHRGL
jgi:large repetitive protein